MGYLALLRRPRPCALWTAQTFSVIGDRLYMLAVAWLVWDASRSAALLGLAAVAGGLPYVLVGTAGRRVLPRLASLRALAAVDAARAVVAVALPVWWTVREPSVAVLFGVAVLLGTLGAVFEPNLKALLPGFVAPGEIRQVVALLDAGARVARFAAPGAAAVLLVAVPAQTLYAIDAATFVVSAAALATLGRATAPAQPEAPAARTQLPVLRGRPELTCAIAVHGVATLLTTVTIALPILVTARFHAGASAYATASACIGAGALLGNALAGHLRSLGRFPASYCAAWVACGLMLGSLGLAPTPLALDGLCVLLGITTPFMSVILQTALSAFPHADRIRLMSLDVTAVRAGETAGMLFLPLLASADVAAGFVLSGAATAAVALAGWAVAPSAPRPLTDP
ncbi:MFS transporter [Actinomadura rubteroloni]|uniref:MFS transporter n=1 Tax=Actinomadura rubteroloni TaxID=1926885 RepID=UPI00143D311C|nr:MFS transporter [Actinomadura rubteroloni]